MTQVNGIDKPLKKIDSWKAVNINIPVWQDAEEIRKRFQRNVIWIFAGVSCKKSRYENFGGGWTIAIRITFLDIIENRTLVADTTIFYSFSVKPACYNFPVFFEPSFLK